MSAWHLLVSWLIYRRRFTRVVVRRQPPTPHPPRGNLSRLLEAAAIVGCHLIILGKSLARLSRAVAGHIRGISRPHTLSACRDTFVSGWPPHYCCYRRRCCTRRTC